MFEIIKKYLYKPCDEDKNESYITDNIYNVLFDEDIEIKFGLEIEFKITNNDINENDIKDKFKHFGIDFSNMVIKDRAEERKYDKWQLMKENQEFV